MSNVTNTDPVVTESKLTEFYEDIKPFLGCPAYVTQEGDEQYYSTNEKVIGRWIDGRPLYQKSYYVPSISAEKYEFDDWTNKTLVSLEGTFKDGSNQRVIPYADGNYFLLVAYYSGKFQTWKSGFGTVTDVYVTATYTKSTDSAATTIETKPTHYSTDEQVVGTWIDNRPVYQKTITGNASFPALTWNTVAFLPENIIILEGTAVWNYNSFNAQIIACDWFYSTSDNSLQIFNTRNNSYVASPSSFTIRYVKPTD